MAATVEELFIERNLKEGSVFDFGCGDARLTRRIAKTHLTTAIDIFTPASSDGFVFIPGDIMKTAVHGSYDNVYAASSLEHVGLGFRECGYSDPDADKTVADILARIVSRDGLIIVTVPLGENRLFVYNDHGEVGSIEEIQDPYCGYRTYDVDGIKRLFPGFDVVKYEAYIKEVGRLDFSNDNPDTWRRVTEWDIKSIQPNYASLCIVLRKNG
jgi:SAM-dependent methyltransferase